MYAYPNRGHAPAPFIPTVMIYFTVFNTIGLISITNQCFIKLLCERPSRDSLRACQDTHWGQNSFFFPFFPSFSLSVSLCPRVIRSRSGLLNGPQCSPSPYHVTFDLFGQRDQQRLQGEERAKRHPSQSGGSPAQFNRRGTK